MSNVTKQQFKRVWFITGASRGLGALMAKAAIADGNAVVATGRNAAAIDERLGEPAAVLPVALDVTDVAIRLFCHDQRLLAHISRCRKLGACSLNG
ncbi:short chain dehydrogenase [Burkholderia sp. YR290]|jgi:NAD(P)-dependent dehydrogenase (short-subunit alcohol dehydrogenase family)|nr:short chain dehydrogenase [Paraburkholderia hospita]SOE89922.1 short chain dehydrogenase [Burkholderia sp. YR290]